MLLSQPGMAELRPAKLSSAAKFPGRPTRIEWGRAGGEILVSTFTAAIHTH